MKERIRSEEYYNLTRKLWVETMARAITTEYRPGELLTGTNAASIANEAVAEFMKHFEPAI